MPSLSELQRHIAQALLAPGPMDAQLCALVVDPVMARAAWNVHRSTVFGSLLNCLRRSYPTVAALLGDECFDALGIEYVRANPPRDAVLAAYGAGFSGHLGAHELSRRMHYLEDCARFDWLLDQYALLPPGAPVMVLEVQHAVDMLREAVISADESALAEVDLSVALRRYSLRRSSQGVCVSRIY